MGALSDLYQKRGYMDRYGIQVWISLITCAIFLFAIGYLNVYNNTNSLQKDWAETRCDPIVMPFAGMIHKEDGLTPTEYTQKNFEYCLNKSMYPLAKVSYKPFKNVLPTLLGDLNSTTQSILNMKLRLKNQKKATQNNQSSMTDSVNHTMNEMHIALQNVNNIGKKMNGTTILLTRQMNGSLYTVMSVMNRVFDVVLKFQKMTGINIIKKCFAKETPIKLANGITTPIEEIRIGNVLFDGSVVTSTMILSSDSVTFYDLGGVVVTHNHNVFHPIGGWIHASQHPDAKVVSTPYLHDHIYCFNTTSKTIRIGNYTFSDWDDIDDEDLQKIRRYYPGVEPNNIHILFDNGYPKDLVLTLESGKLVQIGDLKPMDRLCHGERIYGVVRVGGLGAIRYHLLTETGTFRINGVLNGDYNTLVEKYL